MPADVSSLLKILARLEAKVALLERNQRVNNIGNTSIEGGALVVTDGNGNTQLALGLQPDGTYAAVATSPTAPLAPSAPVMADTALGVSVSWDGNMADGSTPLSDFACVQVHLSVTPGFTPGPSTLHGTMTVAGLVNVSSLLAATTYYGTLVAVNASGNPSSPGAYASALSSAISAQHVAANAFGLNMVADPQFTMAALNASRAADPASSGTWVFGSGQATSLPTTAARLALMPSGTPPVWVSPGEQYYVSATFTTTAANSTLDVSMVTDGGTAQLSQAGVGAGTHTLAGIVTVPSGATQAYFLVSCLNSSANSVTIFEPVMQAAQLFSPTILGTDYIINTSGEFFYNGTPAANALRVSIVPGVNAVQDPSGNWALPGVTHYTGSGPYNAYNHQANAILSETATVMTGVSSPWLATTLVVFNSPVSPGVFLAGTVTSTGGTPANPTVITTDAFSGSLTLAGTWSNNGADILRASLMPDASVWICGRISNTGNQVSGNVITTLPAGYFNTSRNSFGVGAIANSNTALPMEVSTAGSMTLTGGYTAGQALVVNMRYPLNIV